jgi:hypothetical protein
MSFITSGNRSAIRFDGLMGQQQVDHLLVAIHAVVGQCVPVAVGVDDEYLVVVHEPVDGMVEVGSLSVPALPFIAYLAHR